MTSPGSHRFRSDVDLWLIVVIVGAVLFVVYSGFAMRNLNPGAARIAFAAAAFIALLIATIGVPCRYTLGADSLLIQSGLIRWRIAYRDITKIEASSSPISAPAWSLRRVKISFGRSFQLVSPREREIFMRLLALRVASARP